MRKLLEQIKDLNFWYIVIGYSSLFVGCVLLAKGYYLDAICMFLWIIAITLLDMALDRRSINTTYEAYLKRWLEQHETK